MEVIMNSKNNGDPSAPYFIVLMSILVGLAIFTIGMIVGARNMQKEAVKRGHAIWYVDENGDTYFNWK